MPKQRRVRSGEHPEVVKEFYALLEHEHWLALGNLLIVGMTLARFRKQPKKFALYKTLQRSLSKRQQASVEKAFDTER